MGVRLDSILTRACSRCRNRVTTSSIVVGAGEAMGCCSEAACTATGMLVSGVCWEGCAVCASLVLLGSAEGCESAACWPAALIEANSVAVNIAFQGDIVLSVSGRELETQKYGR